MFDSLGAFVDHLRERDKLVTIDAELSTDYEIAAAVRLVDQRFGKAVLCRSVRGSTMPVVANILARRDLMQLAFESSNDATEEYARRMANPPPQVAPKVVKEAPVQEVIHDGDFDLTALLPLLLHHEKDAARYISSGVTVSRDPETGLRGMGIYRIQVRGPQELTISIGSPPVSDFLAKANAQGTPLPVAIAVGMEPVSYFASVAPVASGVDKFDAAGALRGAPVRLVKARTQDVEVYADAEIVLEGETVPNERRDDGPVGESTGYYHAGQSWAVRVTAVTHRAQPIYYALVPFAGENTLLMGVTREADLLASIRSTHPSVQRIHLTQGSVGMLAVIQVEKTNDAEGEAILRVALESFGQVKTAVLVDSDVDPFNLNDLQWAISTRFQPDRDLIVLRNMPGSPIDPTAERGRTAKLGLDATSPLAARADFERIALEPAALRRVEEILAQLAQTRLDGAR